jgi:hypothetical protein
VSAARLGGDARKVDQVGSQSGKHGHPPTAHEKWADFDGDLQKILQPMAWVCDSFPATERSTVDAKSIACFNDLETILLLYFSSHEATSFL